MHDPDGIVEQADDDERDLVRRRVLELDQIAQRRDVAGWLVARAIARQQPAEAAALYLRLGLMALVTLLRNEACPWRFDYGLRYLTPTCHPDQRARVESLLPGAAPLAELSAACFAWMDELLAAPPTRGSALATGWSSAPSCPRRSPRPTPSPGWRRTTAPDVRLRRVRRAARGALRSASKRCG